MKFKDNVFEDDVVYTDDPYYDLIDGGYIKPEDMLTSASDLRKVLEAIDTIETFLAEAEEKGFIEIE